MIRGLKGLTFVDKTDGMKEKEEGREEIRITGFTDRLYQRAPDEVTLGGLEGGRCLKLTKVSNKTPCPEFNKSGDGKLGTVFMPNLTELEKVIICK